MKRIGLLILLAVGLVAVVQPATAQVSSVPARVQTERLVMLEGPDVGAAVVGELLRDTIIIIEGRENVIGNGGIWVYGSVDGKLGWVDSGYLRLPTGIKIDQLPIIDITTTAPIQTTVPLLPIGRTWNDVNLRQGPGLTYTIIGLVPVNTDLNLTGRTDDGTWVQVYNETYEGWLFAELLDIPLGVESLPVIAAAEATFQPVGSSAVTVTDVNLRSAPGLSAEIVAILAPRTPLTILEADGDWIRVQAGGTDGWVFRALIQTEDGSAPPPADSGSTTISSTATGGFYTFPMGVSPGGVAEDNDTDGRINPYMYMATGIIYCIDGNGYVDTGSYSGGGVLVYLYYAPVQGVVFFSPESEIRAVGIPAAPTLIRAEGGFAFYRLPNGNFQMNGPNTDGSIFSFEWNGCQVNPITQ